MSKSPYQIIEESRLKEAQKREMLEEAQALRKPNIWDVNDEYIRSMSSEDLKEYLLVNLKRFDLHKDVYIEIVKAVRKDLSYMGS